MKDVKMLETGSLPCWYELSWRGNEKPAQLVLRIHAEAAERALTIPADTPEVEDFMKTFSFKAWSGTMGANWGFEDSLRYIGAANDFLEYEITIPCVAKSCEACGGTGHDDLSGRQCFFCENGVSIESDFTPAIAVSASCSMMFQIFRYPDYETSSNLKQLMTIGTATFRGCGGGSISGTFGPEMADYLRALPAGPLLPVALATRGAYEKLHGRVESFRESGFRALVNERGRFVIDCTAAVGLTPDDDITLRSGAMRFASHNVDSSVQQLQLLAGLAALHDLARLANQK